MSNIVYIAASIDGFIAAEDGGLDWLTEIPNPDNSDYGFADFMNRIDAIVMGRNTYEKVLTFGEWPYSKKVFILSKSLKEIPPGLTSKIEIVKESPHGLVKLLNDRGYHNLYIDGGRVIQSFLECDMIDEMIITRIPIILGKGIPLFSTVSNAVKFSRVETKVLNDLLVKHIYRK